MSTERTFSIRDCQHLRVSSNDEEEEEPPPQPPPVVLCEAKNWPTYVPCTLRSNNRRRRYSILPAFPTSMYDKQPPLLLPNVPCMFASFLCHCFT